MNADLDEAQEAIYDAVVKFWSHSTAMTHSRRNAKDVAMTMATNVTNRLSLIFFDCR